MSLPRNRLHVFANHLVVTSSHIADVRPNDEHVAGIPERKVCLVLKTDSDVQRTVLNRVRNKVHYLPVNLGIFPAVSVVAFFDRLFDFFVFPRTDRCYRRASNPYNLPLLTYERPLAFRS